MQQDFPGVQLNIKRTVEDDILELGDSIRWVESKIIVSRMNSKQQSETCIMSNADPFLPLSNAVFGDH